MKLERNWESLVSVLQDDQIHPFIILKSFYLLTSLPDFLVLTPPELTREQYVAFLDGKPLPPGIPVTSSSSSSSDPTQSTQKRVGHLSASDAMEVKLFEAASDGRDEVARMILKNHPRIEVNWKNQKGFDGWTALHQACGRGRGIVVTLLLAHPGIDVNQKTDGGRTPFLTACRNGRTSCVQLLLEDPNVTTLNEPDNDGFTPLWYAAKNGHLDVIKVWIASGREMDLGEPGNDKNDAIGAAKKSGRIEVVSLLERWRDFEVRKELGITGECEQDDQIIYFSFQKFLFHFRFSCPYPAQDHQGAVCGFP